MDGSATCCTRKLGSALRERWRAVRLQVLGEHDSAVRGMLEEFGVRLRPAAYKQVLPCPAA